MVSAISLISAEIERWRCGPASCSRQSSGHLINHDTLQHAAAAASSSIAALAPTLTVIVPAYSERVPIGDTIRSLQAQTVAVKTVIVVDDCSTDGTGAVARSLGATVVRPLSNTGSKAAEQNFALSGIDSAFTMAIEADTTLAPDAVERLLAAFPDSQVAAACGFVEPRYHHSVWERVLTLLFMNPVFFLAYVLDAPVIIIPVLLAAGRNRKIGGVLASVPAFFVLRTVNSMFILEALWSEVVQQRPLLVYEKGYSSHHDGWTPGDRYRRTVLSPGGPLAARMLRLAAGTRPA